MTSQLVERLLKLPQPSPPASNPGSTTAAAFTCAAPQTEKLKPWKYQRIHTADKYDLYVWQMDIRNGFRASDPADVVLMKTPRPLTNEAGDLKRNEFEQRLKPGPLDLSTNEVLARGSHFISGEVRTGSRFSARLPEGVVIDIKVVKTSYGSSDVQFEVCAH